MLIKNLNLVLAGPCSGQVHINKILILFNRSKMWFILILIYICIYLLHIETKRLVFHRQFKHIPSNREYPIIGSSFTIRCSKTNEFVKVSDLLCPAPISKFTAFGELVFAISDPGITQKVLLSPVFHKRSDTIRFFEMENALFTSKYENWKPLRKPLNPTFAKRAVLSMQPRINEHIDRLVAQIGMKVGTGTFEVFPLVAKFDIEEVFGKTIYNNYKNVMFVKATQSV